MTDNLPQSGLVLTRKVGESFLIGGKITVILDEVIGQRAKIRIVAPRDVPIIRTEIVEGHSNGTHNR